MSSDRRIAEIAARHFGIFTRAHALRVGFTPPMIRHRLVTGRWVRLHRAIYLIGGTPLCREGEILAAVWAIGDDAVASFDSASWLWGFKGAVCREPRVSVRDRRRVMIAGISVHRPVLLPKRDTTRIGVIPVTTVLRTMIDVSARLGAARLEDLVDDGILRGAVDPARALARVRQLRCSGREGLVVLDELLTERLHPHASGSRLEAELWRAIQRSGLPVPERECDVYGRDGVFIARVDFAYPAERVAIEVDGYAYHQGRKRFDSDHERHNRLIDAGWLPLLFTKPHIFDTQEETLAGIQRALRRRQREVPGGMRTTLDP